MTRSQPDIWTIPIFALALMMPAQAQSNEPQYREALGIIGMNTKLYGSVPGSCTLSREEAYASSAANASIVHGKAQYPTAIETVYEYPHGSTAGCTWLRVQLVYCSEQPTDEGFHAWAPVPRPDWQGPTHGSNAWLCASYPVDWNPDPEPEPEPEECSSTAHPYLYEGFDFATYGDWLATKPDMQYCGYPDCVYKIVNVTETTFDVLGTMEYCSTPDSGPSPGGGDDGGDDGGDGGGDDGDEDPWLPGIPGDGGDNGGGDDGGDDGGNGGDDGGDGDSGDDGGVGGDGDSGGGGDDAGNDGDGGDDGGSGGSGDGDNGGGDTGGGDDDGDDGGGGAPGGGNGDGNDPEGNPGVGLCGDATTSPIVPDCDPASDGYQCAILLNEFYQRCALERLSETSEERLGDSPETEAISERSIAYSDATGSIDESGSGWTGPSSCPAPRALSLGLLGSHEFSFDPLCLFLEMLSPILHALAWVIAAFIYLRSLMGWE